VKKHNTLNQYQHIVAIGGGHGLGRVLSSLSCLDSDLTGIVTTTDNGGSTGRLRAENDCIAWGDLRNCLTQLAKKPAIGSLLFEYRFSSDSELNGHNLGNLMFTALDELCVRPLEAVNLVRQFLNIDTQLIPMSEESTHLVAVAGNGESVFGEINVDKMEATPVALSLDPMVKATCEACDAIRDADLIILGPGSFLTSIMPPLLLPSIAKALAENKAEVILIDNLTDEPSPIAHCNLAQKLDWCHQVLGLKVIDKVLSHSETPYQEGQVSYYPLRSQHHRGLHDKEALAAALADMLTDKQSLSVVGDIAWE